MYFSKYSYVSLRCPVQPRGILGQCQRWSHLTYRCIPKGGQRNVEMRILPIGEFIISIRLEKNVSFDLLFRFHRYFYPYLRGMDYLLVVGLNLNLQTRLLSFISLEENDSEVYAEVQSRIGCNFVAHDGECYLFLPLNNILGEFFTIGGLNKNHKSSGLFYRTNLNNRITFELPAISPPRDSPAVIANGHSIFIFGGYNCECAAVMATCERFDIITNR